MAPPPTPIYAFRVKKWILITTKDLLPGDLISLAFKKRSNTPQAVPPVVDKSKIKHEKKNDEQVSTSTRTKESCFLPQNKRSDKNLRRVRFFSSPCRIIKYPNNVR